MRIALHKALQKVCSLQGLLSLKLALRLSKRLAPYRQSSGPGTLFPQGSLSTTQSQHSGPYSMATTAWPLEVRSQEDRFPGGSLPTRFAHSQGSHTGGSLYRRLALQEARSTGDLLATRFATQQVSSPRRSAYPKGSLIPELRSLRGSPRGSLPKRLALHKAPFVTRFALNKVLVSASFSYSSVAPQVATATAPAPQPQLQLSTALQLYSSLGL